MIYNKLPIPADIVHRNRILRIIKIAIISPVTRVIFVDCAVHYLEIDGRLSNYGGRSSETKHALYTCSQLTQATLRVAFRLCWRRVGD